MIVALLAVLKAGGGYVPLDPAYPAERLAYVLEDSEPLAVLTHGPALSALSAALARQDRSPVVLEVDTAGAWAAQPAANPGHGFGLTARHLAYVIYTSGSTGRPKGVMVEHQSFRNLVHWYVGEFTLSSDDSVLIVASFSFDATQKNILSLLSVGGKVCLAGERFEPKAIIKQLVSRGISMINLTPTAFHLLVDAAGDGELRGLQRVFLGSELIQPARLSPFLGSKTEFFNIYGPTECTDITAYYPVFDVARHNGRNIPIGHPIPNARIYILDGEGESVPVGVTGELFIGGAAVARGYLKRPDLTAERFIASPFVEGERLYRTGDLGRYLPDGNIEFLGRNDFQVKIRGYRIELGEIEARLTSHVGVGEALVVAHEDNGGDQRLVAYYTPAAAHAAADAEQLRMHLSAVLPEYMVPSAYVAMDRFPVTPNGKLDRRALPAPDGDAYLRSGYEPPQGEIEETLAGIWCELLGFERVGRHDNFFELGGHSLLAVRMIAKLRQALDRELPLIDLFAHPVLSALARRMDSTAVTILPPIVLAERSGALPLSFAQQRLWFLAQMEGVSAAFHITGWIRLSGRLDREALRFALDRIVHRHEALRTRFVLVDGEPIQQIDAADSGFALVEEDLAGERNQEEVLAALAAAEAGRGFDLERGPLIRGRLLRLRGDEHVLLVTMHHIVSDGWSMGILLKELSALYTARCAGQEDPLPALRIQYGDYAQWQRRWLSGEVLESQAEYWRTALSGAPELLELPTDHTRPLQQSYEGGRIEVELNTQLTARLKALSLRRGTTLFMTILAGFAALLSRLSGQQDIVIGAPVANRTRSEVEGLIGFFVNTLALRLDLSGDPSVHEFLGQVKQRTLSAQTNQELPFEEVVKLIRPVRSLAHAPVFQVMFAWQNNESVDFDLPGLKLSSLESEKTMSQFDLILDLAETGEGISGRLIYATALFDPRTVERYVGYLVRLLDEMVCREEESLSKLTMLSEAELHQLAVEWNATESEYPSDQCIHEMFEAQVKSAPDATAVVYEDRSLSYGELNATANRLAHHLTMLGVRPDDRIAICAKRSPEMIVGLLAVLKAGGAYVPLDPAYPSERLAYMLEDSEPVAVLTHGPARDALDAALARLETSPAVVDMDDAGAWVARPSTNPDKPFDLTSRHLAYVIYTSGSTGKPKGVMVDHRGICNLAVAQGKSFDIRPDSRVVQLASFSFDPCVSEVFTTLSRGASLYLPKGEAVMAGAQLQETIRRYGITHATIPPALLADLTNSKEFKTLKTLIVGGEAPIIGLVKRWSSGRRFLNAYGPTETTVNATLHDCDPDTDKVPPIGYPLLNVRIYILDTQGKPVPVGVTGELYIGGAGVSRGYLNQPDLTAERFIASPFVEGERLYRTGDLGRYLPDGSIEFLGRDDLQVKIRGYRIELGEIEARLTNHAGVGEAVVVAREDHDGDKRLVAYYTLAAAHAGLVDAEKLRAHLLAVLPEYMVPSAYVVMDSFPVTPNGKLDRRALPAPDDTAYTRRGYEPPSGAVEEKLAAIWCEFLGLERVGRHDNFFELGGHSLLAVRMIANLRQAFDIDLPIQAIFKTQTLTLLAAGLEQPSEDDRGLIRLAGREDATPLFCIHTTGEHIDYYRSLATALGAQFAVFALFPPPHWQTEHDALQHLVTVHADTIQAQQPAGPYRLLGWSAGGSIALAVANELERRGESLSYVGMLDAPTPSAANVLLANYWEDTMQRHFLQGSAGAMPSELRERFLRHPENLSDVDLALALPYLKSVNDGDTIQSLRVMYENLVDTWRQLSHIVESKPDPLKAPLHVCRASDSLRQENGAGFDWSILTTADTPICHDIIAASHHSMLDEPYVFDLASAITRKAIHGQ
jgi:amino acid adenylation domain-containing protein